MESWLQWLRQTSRHGENEEEDPVRNLIDPDLFSFH